MGKIGCTVNGILDDSRFNEPMPWIGIYVVAASAACGIAMAVDAFHGFRYRKFWFPCKFFALNATTLTLVGVAVKLAVDLNTSMPQTQDQLAKLSSTAFICTVIGNSMPSLGAMENKELMMNVVALGILIVTVIVNVCIQLGTGVIYVFWYEHAVVMSLMIVLFAILISSSFAIPAAKYALDIKYNKKYVVATKECEACCDTSVTRKLRDDLARHWMMAHTCSPQFVMGRLATCTASGAFCLLNAATLAVAILRSYLMPWCFTFCKGESDYKWSSMLILATQAAAVVGGTIAPATRWFIAIKFRCPNRMKKDLSKKRKGFLSVESYWVHSLYQWRESPLDLRICGQRCRKLVHTTRNKALDFGIYIQRATVVLCKIVGGMSIIFVSQLIRIHRCYSKIVKLVKWNNSSVSSDESESKGNPKLDLSHYVLHLEGEEELIDVMMENDRDAIGHWIRMGRKKQPIHLTKLVEKLNPSRRFEGVYKFDSYKVPSLDSEEPPNSWALPMVTLTSIAVATSNTDFECVKGLMKSVHEGLKYVRVIENSVDAKKNLTNVIKAAEMVWVGVDLHYKWLDVDLRKLALQRKSPKDTIRELSDIAKNKFFELRKNDILGCLKYSPSKWPVKVLAANAMYRICQTLLLTAESRSNECSKVMFETVSAMITDIMGACLTNLQHAISIKCHQSSIEHREEDVRFAILLLGKTEKILEIISSCSPLTSDTKEMVCINEWRTSGKENDELLYESCTTSSTSPDLYLSIDL